MTLSDSTIQRYQPGGDIYVTLVGEYGASSADAIAQAALSGDSILVANAINMAKNGAPLDTSTLGIFADQIATDPLGAPLASLNNQFANSFSDLLKNPFVLLFTALVLLFLLRGIFKK